MIKLVLSWLGAGSGPLGWFATLLLNFFWGKATDAIAKAEAQRESDKAIDDRKNAAVQEELNAKTKAELDAADDALMREL